MRFLLHARSLLGVVTVAVLSACAAAPSGVPIGTSREATLTALGQPTAVWTLNGGERLQYSGQPWGQQVYNVDLDRSGRVATTSQVMAPAAFAAVQNDVWTTQDILRAFGKPALVAQVHSFDGIVWSYRYAEPFGLNKQFHVFIDTSGRVRRTQMTDEPEQIDDSTGDRAGGRH